MRTARRFAAEFLLWALFFSISAGLGYSTLNRYDPRTQLPDAAIYAQLAISGPAQVHDYFRLRVLVPFLVHCVYAPARGHIGSWDPLMFSFLLVNAAFVATTAYLLCFVGREQVGRSVALLGAALYLLNFAVSNLQLAALVDAAEACLLTCVVASMFYGRWFLLPVIGFAGTLAKESFVPFSIVMAISWFFASRKGRSRGNAAWISGMAVLEAVAFTFLMSSSTGRSVSLWSFASSMRSDTNYAVNLFHSLVDRNSWYILVWLLPLGLLGIKRFPRQWKVAALASSITALLLNAYHSTVGGGGGGIGRYIFDVAGPLLSLSAASFLAGRDFTHSTR